MLDNLTQHICLFLAFLFFSQTVAADVILGDVGTNVCPDDYEKISDYRMCVAAMDILGPGNTDLDPNAFPAEDFWGSENDEEFPSGCYTFDDGEVAFNSHPTGTEVSGQAPICGRDLEPPVSGQTLYVGDSDVDYWISRPDSVVDYNVGIGGSTCQDVLENIVEPYLDYFQPTTVVLVCGENDLSAGASVSTTSCRLSSVVKRINGKGAAVIFMGTKDEPSSSSLWGSYAEYDENARNIAKANCGINVAGRPGFTFIDVNGAFKDLGNPDSFYAPDQLHLSGEAYTLWSNWVAAAFDDNACCSWRGDECVQNTASDDNDSTTSSLSCDDTSSLPSCVSGEVTVSGRNKDMKVWDLNIGDDILGVLDGEHRIYEEVYSFGHYNLYSVGSFIAIETNSNNTTDVSPLEISAEHLVFKNDGTDTAAPVRSDDVRVGDHVLGYDGKRTLVVENLSRVERPGVFSPLVSRGIFVASGAIVSSYTTATHHHSGNHEFSYWKIGSSTILSHHVLSHIALSPLRVLCQGGGYKKPCSEWNSEGQLLLAHTGEQLASLLHKALVCAILLMGVLPLFLLEQLWIGSACVDTTFGMIICSVLALLVVVVFLRPRQVSK